MGKMRLQITLCNTCVRDNYGEGLFSTTENVEQAYRERLKGLSPDLMPEFKQQNCFNLCEQFYCVQVDNRDQGFLLKKVSDPDKIRTVCEWVKTCAQSGKFEVTETIQGHLAETVKIPS